MSESQRSTSARNQVRKAATMLALSALLFVGVEIALQIRSQIKFGQSVFNVLTNETRYVVDEETGLKVFRKSHLFKGRQATIRTNALGLRSEQLEPLPSPDTFRLAVIGASTVMGAYAARNEDTFSFLLQELLNRGRSDGLKFEVINAGIPGYGLADQARMADRVILPLRPNLVVVYPGFNDFGGYCSVVSGGQARPAQARAGLPMVTTPSWLLSVELIQKNTVGLRTPPAAETSYRSPSSIDMNPYRAKLDGLVSVFKQAGVPVVLATNARAYRPEQPPDLQRRLSETARFYNPCFDVNGLHQLYDMHNREILLAAQRHGVHAIPLGSLVPGGPEHFVDASHFSQLGERVVAEHLHRFLVDQALVPSARR